MITITRISRLTGKAHRMDLDITIEQLVNYNAGEKVQKAFPNLSAAEREFILSGITAEEWEEYIKVEQDEQEN